MVLVPFEAGALSGICSDDQLNLLNAVDSLRSQGVNHYVSLPQIIVCGDQSSGKSSVLEAISGVPFPTKSDICTRFPTELVLRKGPISDVAVSIVPDPNRSEAEKESLLKFNDSLKGSEDLPELIEKAKNAMGILPHGKAFARDILRVEVSGPDRPQLTIVDLPGLVHSPTKQQSASDMELVRSLVNDYMRERRSVILAVISAKYDYANQIVLRLARRADQSGHRSLGVITKPDKLKPRSVSESTFVSLARNQDVDFHLGWHVLKNMDTEEGEASLTARDAEERRFFSEGVWTTLPHTSLGIGNLRQRLSKVLLAQIVMELPSLIEEIEDKAKKCRQKLDQLGQPRATLIEQKTYLLKISQSFQTLVKAAVDGTYSDAFFGDAQSESGYRKRLRAMIQNSHIDFAGEIRAYGRYRDIISDAPSEVSDESESRVELMNKEDYLEHVETIMRQTRGRELPGTFNPMVIKDLFSEQSKPWKSIVNDHIKSVWDAVKDFLGLVVSEIADEGTSKALFQKVLDPALDQIWSELTKKNAELLAWHQSGHPITYNHYFTETLQRIRNESKREKYRNVLERHLGNPSSGDTVRVNQNVDIAALTNALIRISEPDMDRYAATEAHECTEAYYKVALKRFIDDVAVEVVESALMQKLESIFSPVSILLIADEDIERIAGESEDSHAYRKDLTQQLEIFTKGLITCKQYSSTQTSGKFRQEKDELPRSVDYPPNTKGDSHKNAEISEDEETSRGMSAVEGEVATPKDPPTDVAATENEVIGLDDDWSSWARNSSRKKKSKKGVVWNEEIPRSSSPPTEVATEAD